VKISEEFYQASYENQIIICQVEKKETQNLAYKLNKE
jgi:hypothetical protein